MLAPFKNNMILIVFLVISLFYGTFAEFDKKQCIEEFNTVCPRQSHRNQIEQLKCVIDLHYAGKIKTMNKKCRYIAIGLYQNYQLSKTLGSSMFDRFNHPSECISMNKSTNFWNIKQSEKDIQDIDFTIVTQCSLDRLWMVSEFCRRWPGNIIVTLSGVTGGYIPRIPGCGKLILQSNEEEKKEEENHITKLYKSIDHFKQENDIKNNYKKGKKEKKSIKNDKDKKKDKIQQSRSSSITRLSNEGSNTSRRKLMSVMRQYQKSHEKSHDKSIEYDKKNDHSSSSSGSGGGGDISISSVNSISGKNFKVVKDKVTQQLASFDDSTKSLTNEPNGPKLKLFNGIVSLSSPPTSPTSTTSASSTTSKYPSLYKKSINQYNKIKERVENSGYDNGGGLSFGTSSLFDPNSVPSQNNRYSGPQIYKSVDERKDGSGKERSFQLFTYEFDRSELYPVNNLRNYGLCRVETSHLLYTDIDLWPSSGLYSELHKMKQFNPKQFTDPKHASVVPAFQMLRGPRECTNGEKTNKIGRTPCFIKASPRNQSSLIDCIREPHDKDELRRCQPFDELGNPEGHASTDYKAWYRQTKLRPLPCFRSDRYEPYLVLPASPLTPLFEEEFRGYGKNKIQHVMHLQAIGFTFSVLPKEFVIHFPHAASEARLVWDVKGGSKGSQRQLNNGVYENFLTWLNDTYSTTSGSTDATGLGMESTSNTRSVKSMNKMMKTPICKGVVEALTWSQRAKLRKQQEEQQSSHDMEKEQDQQLMKSNVDTWNNIQQQQPSTPIPPSPPPPIEMVTEYNLIDLAIN